MGDVVSALDDELAVELFRNSSKTRIVDFSHQEQKEWWESMFLLDDPTSTSSSRFHHIFDDQLPRLVTHTQTSGNLNALIVTTIVLLKGLGPEAGNMIAIRKAKAAIAFTKIFLQFAIQELSPDVLRATFHADPDFLSSHCFFLEYNSSKRPGGVELDVELVKTVCDFLIDTEVSDSTSLLHEQVLKLLVTLLSSQLTASLDKQSPESNIFFSHFLNPSVIDNRRSADLLQTLMLHFLLQAPRPPVPRSWWRFAGSLLTLPIRLPYRVASYMWSSVYAANPLPTPFMYTGDFGSPNYSHRGSVALMAMLLLANYNSERGNIYQKTLASIQDSHSILHDGRGSLSDVKDLRLPFSKVYQVLAASMHSSPLSKLLLYNLLSKNDAFLSFLFSRTDLELIVEPLLHSLHDFVASKSKNSSTAALNRNDLNESVYIVLAILVILSQSRAFADSIQHTVIPRVLWFLDRPLLNVNLSSLVVILVSSVAKLHSNNPDSYMMMNCIAVLGNIVPQLLNVDYFAAERFVLLLEVVFKKFLLLGETQPELADASLNYLRLLLDALSACLGANRNSNPSLVYCLLSRKTTLSKALGLEALGGSYSSILKLLEFLQATIDRKSKASRDSDLSPADVLATINTSFQDPSCPQVEVKESVSFKYEEDPNAIEFFVKFIWTIVVHEGSFSWTTEKMRLFDEPRPLQEANVSIPIAIASTQAASASSSSSV